MYVGIELDVSANKANMAGNLQAIKPGTHKHKQHVLWNYSVVAYTPATPCLLRYMLIILVFNFSVP